MKIKFGWKFWFTLILGLAAYTFLFYQLFLKTDLNFIVNTLRQAAWYILLLGVFFAVFMILAQGFFLRKIFKLYRIDLSLKEAVETWLITVPLGAATLGLSGPAVIFYKAQRKGASHSLAVIITSLYLILYSVSSILFALLIGGSAFFKEALSRPSYRLLIIFLIIFVCLLFLFLLHRPSRFALLKLVKKIFPKIVPQGEEEKLVDLSPAGVFSIILSGFLIVFFILIIFILSFAAFKIDISLFSLLKNFAFTQLLTLFSPSGGGLGFVEFGLAGSLKITGLTINQASLIVIVFRAISFWLPAILGWLFFSFRGYEVIKKMKGEAKE